MSFEFIDELSTDDKRALMTKLSYALATNKTTSDFSGQDRAFYDALISAVPHSSSPPIAILVEKLGRATFAEARDHCERVIEKSLPTPVRHQIRSALRHRIVQCLADYLDEIDVPVSGRTLVHNMASLEHAIERQFPGYMKAGLLHRLVRIAA